MTATLALALLAGYVFGSIPFGLLLTRWAGLGDIRAIGSGNIGATNVLRTGNKGLAAATLLLDTLKGTAGVIAGAYVMAWLVDPKAAAFGAAAGGLGAFLGHLYPVWLGFRGGKGVATYIGVLAGLYWPAAIAFCLTWLVVAGLSRLSSLSALVASVVAPLAAIGLGRAEFALLLAPLTLLLYYKHLPNIRRLLAGEEPRIGARA